MKSNEKGNKADFGPPFVLHAELNTERLQRGNGLLGTIISLNKEEEDDEYKPLRNGKNNQIKNLKLSSSNREIIRMKS